LQERIANRKWLTVLLSLSLSSAVVGAVAGGYIADRFGRRPVFIIALILAFGSITLEVIATTPAMFFGGKFLNGFSVGTLQSVTVSYIGEVRYKTSLPHSHLGLWQPKRKWHILT
jgi:MFS transporter, SP family, general alpha glucoside:H+ symporter